MSVRQVRNSDVVAMRPFQGSPRGQQLRRVSVSIWTVSAPSRNRPRLCCSRRFLRTAQRAPSGTGVRAKDGELGHGEGKRRRQTASAAARNVRRVPLASRRWSIAPLLRASHHRSHCRASSRPLFREYSIPLCQDPVHWRHLRLPRGGCDRAIGAAASRRRRRAGFPVLQHLPAVLGDQPCADRPAAVVDGEAQRQRPLQVPGVREGRGLVDPRADVATVWQVSCRT
jgi:hypothetical protein